MNGQGELLRRVVLQVIPQCPQCRSPFEREDVQYVAQMAETWLFSLYCQACQTLSVVGLAVAGETVEGEQVMDKVGPAPSAGEDQERGGHVLAGPITADDVLDMHLFLRDLEDFQSLFTDDDPSAE